MAPPSRPPTFAKSAKLLFSWSAYSSPIGMRQRGRRRAVPPPRVRRRASSSLLMRPLIVRAERDDAGAGQRRDVDDRGRLEAPRVGERVAEDQAAFGVRVQDLDGLARTSLVTMSPGFVARPLGMFSQVGTMPTTLIGSCSLGAALSAPSTLGGAAHVEFHFVHRRRLLQRDAAGVERDALADQHDRRLALAAARVFAARSAAAARRSRA